MPLAFFLKAKLSEAYLIRPDSTLAFFQGQSFSCNDLRKVPEKHGKCVNADHVVCVAVREEELVGRYNPTLALYTVKPDKLK